MKLNYKRTIFVGFAFFLICSFWQAYDNTIPLILTNKFGMSQAWSGVIMALDNVLALFMLPLFGAISDKHRGKRGRRTPFILLGSGIATLSVPLIAIANNAGSLPLLICAILITLLAICMYRTMTVAIVADITPRPLRTKADSVQKIVGYAGTGVMLVAISVMVPNVERPDYLPLFLLQAAFVLVSAVVYGLLVKEPALVQKMHQKSLEMGIREDEVEKDDSPEAGDKERVADRSMRLSIAMLLAATFFYYMSYNAMTTNISRYADIFYGMAGGSYAIINIVTIVGALASYVPLANLSLKVGRKKVALASSVVMVSCPLVLWLVPGFSPVLYLVFLLMGVSLGGVDMCVYTMILECCSSNSVGRYSGYYYTVSMAAQVITPILSGVVMDVNPAMLFAYITGMGVLMGLSVAGAKHGDAILIDEVVRREEAAEAE